MNISVATEAFAKRMRQIDLSDDAVSVWRYLLSSRIAKPTTSVHYASPFPALPAMTSFPALSPLRRLGTPGPWNLCL